MTLPRSRLINSDATPYYHCVSRCVRRAYLCGKDALTGYDFEHRRSWIEARLQLLSRIFLIDLCAYAIMSNHYHVVLHINTEEAALLSDSEIVMRWQKLHRLPDWFDSPDADATRVSNSVALWRERLSSISWFMKSLNEPLARVANKEDNCKGRFWEGRFKSQALLDESSVLKCMTYVDLNPIRADLAPTPEESEYTSVKARIEGRDKTLAPTADVVESGFKLPVTKAEYLALVDWTGRQLRPDKRGSIDRDTPPILVRLKNEECDWRDDMRHLTRRYGRAIGSVASMHRYRAWLGQSRLNGLMTR